MIRWRSWLILAMFAAVMSACDGVPKPVLGSSPTTASPTAILPTPTVSQRNESNNPAEVPADPPSTCPVTLPPNPPFTPPAPYPATPPGDYVWYGTPALWTVVPPDGVWRSLPHNPLGYTQKVLFWREGYSVSKEPEPELYVSGQRLDGAAPSLYASDATNASAADIGSAMLVGVDVPMLGCWQITGRYADAELSFVVWVAP